MTLIIEYSHMFIEYQAVTRPSWLRMHVVVLQSYQSVLQSWRCRTLVSMLHVNPWYPLIWHQEQSVTHKMVVNPKNMLSPECIKKF